MFRERSSARFLSLGPNTSAEPSQSLALLGLSWGLWAWFLGGFPGASWACSLVRPWRPQVSPACASGCAQTAAAGFSDLG